MVSGQASVQGPRGRGDLPADAYVAKALERVDAGGRVRWLLEQVGTLRDNVPAPEWAAEWMASSEGPPPWLDEQRLVAGQGVFDDWCLPISICLFCASLPKAYAAKAGVQVLTRMSQLNQSRAVGTRIGNTGRMLLDISAPGGLAEGAPGQLRLRRVRLLHATSRALVELNPEPDAWWSHDWGVPVNQEDQVGTLLSFSLTVAEAMRSMGLGLSTQEEKDYFYLWSVVGWHLGTEMPERIQSPSDARALQEDLEERLFGPSPEGTRLMALLLDDMRGTMPRVVAGMPEALVYRLTGARIATYLDVQASRTWRFMLATGATLTRVVMFLPKGRAALAFPSRRWGRALIAHPRDGDRRPGRRRTPGPRAAATRPLHATR
jgi:hypothetical protein